MITYSRKKMNTVKKIGILNLKNQIVNYKKAQKKQTTVIINSLIKQYMLLKKMKQEKDYILQKKKIPTV